MSKDSSSKPTNFTLSKDDILPMPQEQRASWFSNYAPAIAGTVAAIAANASQRQALANLRLGSNTGENWGALVGRFRNNPSTILSGFGSRFSLQLLTQGAPMAVNRAGIKRENGDPIFSGALTALLMTVGGIGFEVANFGPPIKDKARSFGLGEINYLNRSPIVGTTILLPMLVRNNVYAQVVFGQKDKTLPEKVMLAVAAGTVTNPIDNIINFAAYQAAIAKDEDSVFKIFKETWKHFTAAEKSGHPYERFMAVARNSFDAVPMRMLGVGGAALLLSREVGDVLEKEFKIFVESAGKFLEQFGKNMAEENSRSSRGGVKLISENPSSSPYSKKGSVTQLAQMEDMVRRRD